MNLHLLTLWYTWRWRLAKWGTSLLLLAILAEILWIPQLHTWQSLRLSRQELLSAQAQRPLLLAQNDSLQKNLTQLAFLRSRLDTLCGKGHDWPLDSLRKSAELAKLHVTSLEPEARVLPGFTSVDRLGLEGNYADMLSWLQSLDVFHPQLQILRLQWSLREKELARVSNLEIGHASAEGITKSVSAGPSLTKVWLTRAKRLDFKPTPISETAPGNPFVGIPLPHTVSSHVSTTKLQALEPPPPFRILGLVAGRLATVELEKGSRRMLRPGDALGDWTVESVSANALVLTSHGERKSFGMGP
ncbi:MAG TPA: hypothetical protein VLM37_13480 [Fibrobacteraceae bacterium]|nr:hypothetical protein [Fibrobacteraceae bacterium]